MKKLHHFALLAVLFAVGMSRQNAVAQPNFGNGNFDPQQMMQQMQQRVIDNLRDQLAVTNDTDWNVIEPKLTKLTQGAMDSMMSQMREMMAGMMGGGGPGGAGGGMLDIGAPDPDAEALQKLLDAHAPIAQIRTALAKYNDSRKQKQADLEKAQADLRSVLTTRQEAILVLAGVLD